MTAMSPTSRILVAISLTPFALNIAAMLAPAAEDSLKDGWEFGFLLVSVEDGGAGG
jgi:hypothetical protein